MVEAEIRSVCHSLRLCRSCLLYTSALGNSASNRASKRSRHCAGAVSYTHLDVYKRQAYSRPVSQRNKQFFNPFLLIATDIQTVIGNRHQQRLSKHLRMLQDRCHQGLRGHMPVSYTHLDVYKRQDQGQRAAMRKLAAPIHRLLLPLPVLRAVGL